MNISYSLLGKLMNGYVKKSHLEYLKVVQKMIFIPICQVLIVMIYYVKVLFEIWIKVGIWIKNVYHLIILTNT